MPAAEPGSIGAAEALPTARGMLDIVVNWRVATMVAVTIAAIELVVIVLGGMALLARPYIERAGQTVPAATVAASRTAADAPQTRAVTSPATTGPARKEQEPPAMSTAAGSGPDGGTPASSSVAVLPPSRPVPRPAAPSRDTSRQTSPAPTRRSERAKAPAVAKKPAAKPKPSLVVPARLRVAIVNRGGIRGAGKLTASRVNGLGYPVVSVVNAARMDTAAWSVLHAPGLRAEAERLASALRVRTVAPLPEPLDPELHRPALVIEVGR